MNESLLRTPLYDLHLSQGAKMISFAGYEMPVQYPAGVMKEHLHTRKKAGLFDVSHMGQIILRGKNFASVATALEKLIPMDVIGLQVDRQRYGFFTNKDGGIDDDVMFANRGDHIFLVVNAACKMQDITHLKSHLSDNIQVEHVTNRALLALQGPKAEYVLKKYCPGICQMKFMDVATLSLSGAECWVSRSGYTGEDGFEISIPTSAAELLAKTLLKHEDVEFIGLGARDSLRLEAGFCLYGHDLDQNTSPVEANLSWAMQTRRRKEGGFLGAKRILGEIVSGSKRKRIGIIPEGRTPVRKGISLFSNQYIDQPIGVVTSGGFSPTLGVPIAMGYVLEHYSNSDIRLFAEVRGKRLPVKIVKFPFIGVKFKKSEKGGENS